MQTEILPCPRCAKPPALCICDRVEPFDTQLRIVILQHPQENDAVLGTAKLVTLTLPKAEIRVGLSWASLDHAVGLTEANRERWAVLAGVKLGVALPDEVRNQPVVVIDRRRHHPMQR